MLLHFPQQYSFLNLDHQSVDGEIGAQRNQHQWDRRKYDVSIRDGGEQYDDGQHHNAGIL